MNLFSHATLTNRICKNHFTKKARAFIVVGSLLPDFNPLTQPHRGQNLLIRIYNNYTANPKNEFVKLIRLGILFHYICDYFCYAHNYNLDISHGKLHFEYEVDLHKKLKKIPSFKEEKVDFDNYMKYIIEIKARYDNKISNPNRDLRYCIEVMQKTVEDFSK